MSIDYWSENLPQTWYSNKNSLSNEWFNEIEYRRYKSYYPYLPEVAEFNAHSGENVLEIGIGIGTDLLQYAKGGAMVWGMDSSERAVDLAKRNLRRLGYGGTITIGDATKLYYKDNFFDLVYCFGVLHHIKDTQKAIDEIYRVLKPNGKAIIMLYAAGWKHIIKRILIHGILKGDVFRYGYQGMVNKNTEVNGNSPLTKVYLYPKKLFKQFGDVEMSKHRLGEYFDYAPYNSRKLPKWIVRLCYLFGLETILGENWIIKAVKGKRKRLPFIKTLLKP